MSSILNRLREALPEARVQIDTIIEWFDRNFPGNQLGLPDHLYSTAIKVDQLKRSFPDNSDLLERYREELFQAAVQLEAPPEENFNMNNINTSPPGGEPRGGKRRVRFSKKSKTRKTKRSRSRKSSKHV
jgi:hypothetical protein